MLCSSLVETACQPESENNFGNQKKEMISKAMRSLIKVYEGRNQHSIAKKFEMLDNNIW